MIAKSRIRIPIFGWAVLLLLPIGLFVPWVFVLLAPALFLAGIFGIGWAGFSHMWEEKAPEGPVDVLMLEGFEEAPTAEIAVRRELDALFEETPASEDPVACACIKKDAGRYVGVLRTRTHHGHTAEQFFGASPEDVGQQIGDKIAVYRASSPERTPEAEVCGECDSASCPMGRKSVFYVHRDDFGRPRARLDDVA